jgi:hypothetical protein
VRLARRAAMLLVPVLLLAGAASAEVVQRGNLQVTTSGGLSPKRLPRTGTAPIAITVGGGIATVDGNLPPQLKKLRIEFNRHGRLETTGLPECRIGQIQPASTAQALSACRPALVGRGSFSIEAVLGGQQPYPTKGRLLVFNGSYNGRPALLGQIYSAHPFTNSFVIPFRIARLRHKRYGLVLSARLPRAFTEWGYVTGLELVLERRYSYRGRSRSFISAGCPAAKGFREALFTLTRTTFTFSGQMKVSSTVSGDCKVRS